MLEEDHYYVNGKHSATIDINAEGPYYVNEKYAIAIDLNRGRAPCATKPCSIEGDTCCASTTPTTTTNDSRIVDNKEFVEDTAP